MSITRSLLSVSAALAALVSTPVLSADSAGAFPSRPVTIVLPFTSGGSTDIETRLYQPRLIEFLKQPALIDYKPGAGSSLGTIYVAKSAPDGYTILAISTGFSVYPAFFPIDKQPYDTVKDFSPLSLINERFAMLLVRQGLPVKNFQEYVAYTKANPGKLNFGTSGAGGIFHIAGAWLHSLIKTEVTFVHYKGAGPMNNDLVAGRLDAAPGLPFVVAPHVKSGKMVPIANMTATRSKFMPDLVPIAESGVPEYDYTSYSAYVGPAGMPAAIVNRWNAAFAFVAKAPEVISRMETNSAEMVGSSTETLRKKLIAEQARYRKIVQENGMKLEP